jgi:DNA-binding LacI/PurR family transcriptional regulator
MDSINGEPVEDKVYVMEPELVIRETTAPPRS